jgi:hypothetical protein
VNGWADLTKGNLSRFQLTDGEGKEASGYARRGWHFRIDLPAPGTDAGRGFDWVKVEEIIESTSEETESIGLRVKPTSDPGSESEETAHFYSSLSTSTFTITREGKKVTDQLRNVLVGAAGMVAFSKIQWKLLADALLGNPEV